MHKTEGLITDWPFSRRVDAEGCERIITDIRRQKKNPNRVSIYIDEKFAFGLPKDLVPQFALRKGMFLSKNKEKDILESALVIRAKEVALHYLSYKPRTEHEVRTKLLDKGFEEELAEQVVERFRTLKYLNDEQYAQMFAASQLRSKGRGPKRIRMELKRKGVEEELIELALVLLEETKDVLGELRPRAEKKWTTLQKEPERHKRRKKFQEYIVRQGFDFGIASQLLEELQMQVQASDADEEGTESTEPTTEDFTQHAEKIWRRVHAERDVFKRKKKFIDAMRRKGAPYAIAKEWLNTFVEEEALEQVQSDEQDERELDSEHAWHEEEHDPLEEIRPIAEKRWNTLCRTESNAWKRKKKLSDHLLRKGFAYDTIRLIQEELNASS